MKITLYTAESVALANELLSNLGVPNKGFFHCGDTPDYPEDLMDESDWSGGFCIYGGCGDDIGYSLEDIQNINSASYLLMEERL